MTIQAKNQLSVKRMVLRVKYDTTKKTIIKKCGISTFWCATVVGFVVLRAGREMRISLLIRDTHL